MSWSAGTMQLGSPEIRQHTHERKMRVKLCSFSENLLRTLMHFHLPFPEDWPRKWVSASPVNTCLVCIRGCFLEICDCAQDVPAPSTMLGDVWARAVLWFPMESRPSDATSRGLSKCVPHKWTGYLKGSGWGCSHPEGQSYQAQLGWKAEKEDKGWHFKNTALKPHMPPPPSARYLVEVWPPGTQQAWPAADLII